MKKTEIINKLSLSFNRVGMKFKKHSPEILVVAGVVGTVTSAVMACKATTKIDTILDEHKETVEKIHDVVEEAKNGERDDYTVEDGKKDLTIVYTQTGLKLVKLYAPAVVVGVASVTSILAGHNILRKRNAALATAYMAIDKGFKEYRGRVVERFGKELDYELRHNIKAEEVEEVITNEDGSETVVKKTVNVADPNNISGYAKIWCEGNTGWSKDPEYNLFFLKKQQAFANEKLKQTGYLYLNEVYDMLGFPRTKAGQIVGWVYDEKHPVGDNFVDFGLFNDINDERKQAFVNGYERSVLLDFNVDGPILDLM